jgi:hypothetical protein
MLQSKVMAGTTHWHLDCAADCCYDGLHRLPPIFTTSRLALHMVLQDDQPKVWTMPALGLAALAEAAAPYGKSPLSSFVNSKPLTKR